MNGAATLLFACALGACATPVEPSQEVADAGSLHPLIGDEIGLDHVLLWSKDNVTAEATLERLGFSLSEKAGSYGAGISNKLIWFRNWSFIEFLWLSDPTETQREAPKEYAFATAHNGSNAYGVSIADADETFLVLNAAGLNPDHPGAEAYDPDGPAGPKEPVVNQWRFMFLKDAGLAGNPFFVEYNSKASGSRTEQHPNGALRMSSVWVLVDDVDAAVKAYEGAKFSAQERVSLSELDLAGVSLPAGAGEVLLLTPTANGPFRDALQARGNHVVGISIQVANLGSTKKLLSQRIGGDLQEHLGRFGSSLLVPTLEPLGLAIEFHQ